jgi:hypothetical protein
LWLVLFNEIVVLIEYLNASLLFGNHMLKNILL